MLEGTRASQYPEGTLYECTDCQTRYPTSAGATACHNAPVAAITPEQNGSTSPFTPDDARSKFIASMSDAERSAFIAHALRPAPGEDVKQWLMLHQLQKTADEVRQAVADGLAAIATAVEDHKAFLATIPPSQAEALGEHIVAFADQAQAFSRTLDSIGQQMKRNLDTLCELTGQVDKLLKTALESDRHVHAHAAYLTRQIAKENKETQDALRTELSRIAGKIRPQKVLTIKEQLLFLGIVVIVAILASGGTIVAMLSTLHPR